MLNNLLTTTPPKNKFKLASYPVNQSLPEQNHTETTSTISHNLNRKMALSSTDTVSFQRRTLSQLTSTKLSSRIEKINPTEVSKPKVLSNSVSYHPHTPNEANVEELQFEFYYILYFQQITNLNIVDLWSLRQNSHIFRTEVAS